MDRTKQFAIGMTICIIVFFTFAIGYNTYLNSVLSAEVEVDPTPTVYVSIPENMDVEGVLSKVYQPMQDIILKADVHDDTEVIAENISWCLIVGDPESATQTPLVKGHTLHIKGGELKAGKHTFGVVYSDIDGYGAEYVYQIEVAAPAVRKEITTKKATKQWSGYVNNNDGTVTHMKTGLTWMIVDDGYDRSIYEALKYAKTMSDKTGKTWAVPTLDDWAQIANMGKNGSHVIDEPFLGLKSGAKYWTRSRSKDVDAVYTVSTTRIVGGGQNLRAQKGLVTLAGSCYTILVTR